MSVKEKSSGYKKNGGSSGYGKVEDLPGQNGNPWPPDAGVNHLAFEGGYPDAIMNQLGGAVTHQESMEMMQAVYGFTGAVYGEIRAVQRGENPYESMWDKETKESLFAGMKKEAEDLEKFISKSIESGNGWNGGATYRGIGNISDAALKKLQSLKPGDSVDPNLGGTASWSTDRLLSAGFGGQPNHVTFVHLGSSQKGVSVANIANYGSGEQEVLVSKDAKFKVTAIVRGPIGESGQTYIYVEDA